MRFSNYNTIRYVPFLYFFIITSIVVLGYLEFKFEQEDLFYAEVIYWIFLGVMIVLLLYIYNFGKLFEYDSDGEALCFRNSGAVLSETLNYRENKAEFPKHKLKQYKISDYLIFKKLSIYVKSNYLGQKQVKKIVFDITFVKPKRISLMKASLNKVVKTNSEKLHERRSRKQ